MPVITKQLALIFALALGSCCASFTYARGDMAPDTEWLDEQPAASQRPTPPTPDRPFHFSHYATSANGLSVARALDASVKAVLDTGELGAWEKYQLANVAQELRHLPPGQLGAVLEQLAGSHNANLGSATQQSLQSLNDGLLEAMRPLSDAPADEGRVWLQGLGNSSQLDSQHGSAGLQQKTQGLLLGADWAVDHAWRIGVTGGKSTSTLSANHFKGSVDSWHLGGYAVRQDGPLALRLGALYNNHTGVNNRTVDFSAINHREHIKGQYTANSQSVFAELGYALDHTNVRTEPFAALGYQRYHRDSYREKGGVTALNVGAQDQQNLSSTLGIRLLSQFALGNQISLQPHLSASWKHLYGDVSSGVHQSTTWSRHASLNRDFTVQGTPLDRDTLALRAGLDLALSSQHTVGLTYTAAMGTSSHSQGVAGQWRMAF